MPARLLSIVCTLLMVGCSSSSERSSSPSFGADTAQQRAPSVEQALRQAGVPQAQDPPQASAAAAVPEVPAAAPVASVAELLEQALLHELAGDVDAAVATALEVLPRDPEAAVETLRRLSPGRLWVAADGSGDVPSLDHALAMAPPMTTIELAPGEYLLQAPISRPVRLLASGGPSGRVWPAAVVLRGPAGSPPTLSAPFAVLDGLQCLGAEGEPALVVLPGVRADLLDVDLTGDLSCAGAELIVDGGRVERGGVTLTDGARLEASFWRLAGAPATALSLDTGAWARLVRPALGGSVDGCRVGAGAELLVEGGALVGLTGDGLAVLAGGRATLVDVRLQDGGGAGLRLAAGAWARLERCRLRGFGELLAIDPAATLEQLDNVLRFR